MYLAIYYYIREAAKKKISSLNGWAIKEKITFIGTFFSNVPTAITLEGPRGVGLNGLVIRRKLFFALCIMYVLKIFKQYSTKVDTSIMII